ncbi:MAG: transporter substrate-binding domain-containing protein [Fervidobacterium sp.]
MKDLKLSSIMYKFSWFAICLKLSFWFFILNPTLSEPLFATVLYTYGQQAEPKYMLKDGKMAGVCDEIIQELNKELTKKDISISYRSSDLKTDSEIFSALKDGKIQVFVGLELDKERYKELKYVFTPIYSLKETILIRKGESKQVITKNTVTIGIVRGSPSSKDVAQVFRNYTFEEFGSISEAIASLDAKKIDAIYYDGISVGFYAVNFPNKYEKLSIETKKYYHYIAFNKNVSNELIRSIEEALRLLLERGTIDKVIERYKLQQYVLAGNVLEFVTIQWPPYEFSQNGDIIGSDVEIIREVFKRLGYRSLFYMEIPSRALQKVKSEAYDGVFSVWKSEDRETFLNYSSEPISSTLEAIWYLKSNAQKMGDILHSANTNYICGYVNGCAYDEHFWQLKCKKIPLESDEMGFKLLKAGRIDAFETAYLTGKFVATQMGIYNELDFMYISSQSRPQYLAFTKNIHGSYLAKMFSDGVKRFQGTNDYRKILLRYGIEI